MTSPVDTRRWSGVARRSRRAVLAALSVLLVARVALSQDQPGPAPPESPANAPEDGGASPPAAAAEAVPPPEVQLSFAGVDMNVISKWLAEVTGKSVYKHAQVNPNLTVMSPNKLPVREAVRLVYQTLALEGFAAIETEKVIYIVPEGMEAKIQHAVIPEDSDRPLEGRQFVVKTFALEHVRARDIEATVRGILSDKAKIEILPDTNKIIVTDAAQNVGLLAELIPEIDTPSRSPVTTEIIWLKHARAEFVAPILTNLFGSEVPRGGTVAPSAPQPGGEANPADGAAGNSNPTAAAPRSGPFRILADEAANRLIITASKERVEEIREFVQLIDVEKEADVIVRVISLRFVDAQELVSEIRPMYERLAGKSRSDMIEISANDRSNSLIVLSSKSDYERIKELVEALDIEEAEKNVTEIFRLEHADAEDAASQLENLFDSTSSSSYSYYYYRYGDEQRKDKVRFVANRRRNEIVAIGPASAMESVRKIVANLDEPVDHEVLAPRIYPLKFVDALDIELVLNDLFVKKKEREMPYWYYDDYPQDEDKDIGRLFGKVKIVSEPYTNSIIVTSNSPENFAAVEAVLKQLDVASDTATTLSVELKYADAVSVANNINILFAQPGAPPRGQRENQPQNPQQPQQRDPNASTPAFQLQEDQVEDSYFPWLGGQQNPQGTRTTSGRSRSVSDLVGKIRVVPDSRTNSLHVTTNSHYFAQILELVEALDVPTPQVLIEAIIVEIAKDERSRLGVRFSPDGARVFDTEDFDDSIIGSGRTFYSEIFSGTNAANALRTGVIEGEINLDVLIQFLQKNSDTRVKAEPRINVADNEVGRLFVGSRIPFITNSQLTDTGVRNDAFEYRDVGIILEVVPNVNIAGEIELKIHVESSQIRPGVTLFGGAIIDTRTYNTDLTVKTDQLIVLGGILQREESEIIHKVPLLGDIPLLGYFFKKKDTVARDVELMVFLRPRVTRSWEEVNRLMEEEGRRTRLIREWNNRLRALDAERRAEAGEDVGDDEGDDEDIPSEGKESAPAARRE